MKKNKFGLSISTPLLLALSSGVAVAQEGESSFAADYWPLILVLTVLIVFSKKLISEAQVHGHDDHSATPPKPVKPSPAPAARKAAPSAAPKPKVSVEDKPKASATAEEVTDLSVNADQCQGSTAKGTRCSRRSNLETIMVTIDGKKYKFSSCKQHNNKDFSPFHFR